MKICWKPDAGGGSWKLEAGVLGDGLGLISAEIRQRTSHHSITPLYFVSLSKAFNMKQSDIKNNLIRRIIEMNDAKLLAQLDKLFKNDDAFLIRHFSSLEKKKKVSEKKPAADMPRKWPEE